MTALPESLTTTLTPPCEADCTSVASLIVTLTDHRHPFLLCMDHTIALAGHVGRRDGWLSWTRL